MAEEHCETEGLASMRDRCELGPGPHMIAHEDRCECDLTIDFDPVRFWDFAILFTVR